MRSLIDTGRAPIALSIQWWGAQGDVGARGLGVAEREEEQAIDLLCTYEGAAVCCVCAESHCSEGRGELDRLLVAGTTALFSSWVGTALSAERHQ